MNEPESLLVASDAVRERVRYRFPTDIIVSVSAVFVSLCALGVSLYQADIQSRTLRAEFWPHVDVLTSWSYGTYRASVVNSGSGPARIRSVRAWLDGKERTSWWTIFETMNGKLAQNMAINSLHNRVLRPGDRVDLFVIRVPKRPQDRDSLFKNRGRIGIEVVYGSVFDDSYKVFVENLENESVWSDVSVRDVPKMLPGSPL